MSGRRVHRFAGLAVLASLALALGAPPADGLTTSPGTIGVQAQTDVDTACFGACPPDFDESFSESVSGVNGRASSSFEGRSGSTHASADEAEGSLRAFLSGRVDLSSTAPGAAAASQGFAGAAINDLITLSAPATILLEGTIAGTLSVARGNDSVANPVSLGARILFTGPRSGEGRVEYGGLNRSYVDGESANESFTIAVDLPAGTSNVNASIQAFTDLRVTSGGAEHGTIDFSNSLNFSILVPQGVTATSASGLLPGTSGPTPRLSIEDAQVLEGNAGTTPLSFAVSLSAPSTAPVTVDYATADGSAGAEDYQATSGSLVFAPAETTKTVVVTVLGDTAAEDDESLLVELRSPVGAILAQSTAGGTIVDDDGPPPPPSGACILVRPEAPLDFGTRPFSRPDEPVQALGSEVTVENCGAAGIDVHVSGTNANGSSATWLLSDSADTCAPGADVYGLTLGTLALSSAAKPFGPIAAAGTRSETLTLTMPCTGSGGAGETLSLQLRFTAVDAP